MKTLAQLNQEVWEEYEKIKKPVCQYLVRNGYKIIQCEYNGANGTTYVHLEDDLHTDIVINWQALGINIYVAKVTDKVIKFLFDEIFLVEDPDSLGAYYIFGADGVDDNLENFLKKQKNVKRKGIEHPTKEAKKYIIKKESKKPIEFYDVYP